MQIMQKNEHTVSERMNKMQREKVGRLIRHALAVTAFAAATVAMPQIVKADPVSANGTSVSIDSSNNISTGGTLAEDEGVSATNGGSVTLTGSNVDIDLIQNPGATGDARFYPKTGPVPNWNSVKYQSITANGTGSTITGQNITVDITEQNGLVSALNGGQIDISNSSITGRLADSDELLYYYNTGALSSSPTNAVGVQTILSQGAGSNVTLNNDVITTYGQDGYYHSAGITAQLEGQVTLGGDITVNSHGYQTYGISAEGWATGGSIITDPNNPLTLNVTTDGENSPGIFAFNAPSPTATVLSSIDLDGTNRNNSSITTTGTGSNGVQIENGSSVTLHNITVNAEGPGSAAVYFQGTDTGTFMGDTVTLNGDIDADSGTGDVDLTNNSILNGSVNLPNGTFTMDSSSVWNNTGSATLNNFTNGNYVFTAPTDSSDPSQYHTLTVNNFIADPGSTITMNVFADGENSTADQVVINDSYTGSPTQIIPVINRGSGDLPNNGIVLVQGNGASFASDDFFSTPVNSGFYTYNGEFSDTSGDSQFLLFSQLNSAAAGASVLPALGTRTILSTLPSVQDRMHAPRLSVTGTGQAAANGGMWGQQENGAQKGIWARLFGGSNKFRSDDSADNGFDTSLWAVQAGYDLMAKKDANGSRSYAGLYLAYGNSSGNAQINGQNVGDVDLDATSVGAYWTMYSPSDLYLSITGQYSWLNGIKASGGGESVSPGGSGFAISLEGGKTLNREKSMLIEPQAQLIYSHTDIDDSVLPAGPLRQTATPIELSNLNSVTGRLGVLFQKNPRSGNNFLPWARVNLWHTFSGSSTMSSPGLDDVETSMNGTSAELTAGFNLLGNEDSKWAIDVSAGYLFNLSGAKNTGWRGNLGARYNF